MNRKNLILIIVINVLLTISKLLIIADFSAKSISLVGKRNYFIFFLGVLIALLLDLLINYLAVKIANKRQKGDKFKYNRVIFIPIVITIIIMILGLF